MQRPRLQFPLRRLPFSPSLSSALRSSFSTCLPCPSLRTPLFSRYLSPTVIESQRESECVVTCTHAGTRDSVGHHEQARARGTHTEEGNLSLTRILNGCAEARTVGTHYSTTHPPPLRQNSTSPLLSSSLLFPVGPAHFPLPHPSVNSSSPLSFSRSLSPSRIPGPPVPHPSTASSRSRQLRSLLYPFSCVRSARTSKPFLCASRMCVHRAGHTHVASFHSTSRSFVISVCPGPLSPSFLREA